MTAYAVALIAAAGAADTPNNALLVFSAKWCGPCRQMAPVVADLARKNHPVTKIDVDRNPALVRKYGVRGIPAFVAVVNGRVVDRTVGRTSKRRLLQMLSKIHIPIAKKSESKVAPVAKRRSTSDSGRNRFRLPLPGFLKKKQPEKIAASRRPRPVFRGNLDSDTSATEPVGLKSETRKAVSPMEASVRIKVSDGKGSNFGSGTIIKSVAGRTIILTCGHVFRGLTKNGSIEVDVFHDGAFKRYAGRLIKYDMKADVGLMSIETETPLPAIALAAVKDAPQIGDAIFSIGCGGGSNPTRMAGKVTTLNRYIGPDNLECSGTPQQGRSGGGLFDANNRLIGVCFAADPPRKCGLYAGLKAIRDLLKQADISLDPAGSPSVSSEALASAQTMEVDRSQLSQMKSEPTRQTSADDEQRAFEQALLMLNGKNDVANALPRPGQDQAQQMKTVEQVFGGGGEAEVICIIRPLNGSNAESRIVVINRASSQFVRYLRGELRSQPQTTAKYLASRHPKSPVESPRFAADDDLVSPFQTVGTKRQHAPVSNGRYRRSAASRR